MSSRAGRCVVGELGGLALFRELSEEQLGRLCTEGRVEHREAGWVYRQGEPAQSLFVLLDGEVRVTATVGTDEVDVYRSDRPGACGGATRPHLGDPAGQRYTTSMDASRVCRLFVLPAASLAAVMREWFPLAVRLQEQDIVGASAEAVPPRQSDRLLALGALASSLTHELNNPAAAAHAAAIALTNRFQRTRESLARMLEGAYSTDQVRAALRLHEDVTGKGAAPTSLSGLELADRQDEVAWWLEANGIRDGWDLAPTFVQAGLDDHALAEVLAQVGPAMADDAVRWLDYALETDLLLEEIREATGRISALLESAKQYGQVDRTPQQLLDVHDLLDATLLVFRRRLGDQHVQVVRDYDRSAPRVTGYAAELNQVWTNLVDNALDAIDGHGTLTIRTRGHRGRVSVEVIDDGPGIPEDVRQHVFEPFFSTKPIGEGTGIGLDVAARIVVARHGGSIDVESAPGRTRFVVGLPVRRATGRADGRGDGAGPAEAGGGGTGDRSRRGEPGPD